MKALTLIAAMSLFFGVGCDKDSDMPKLKNSSDQVVSLYMRREPNGEWGGIGLAPPHGVGVIHYPGGSECLLVEAEVRVGDPPDQRRVRLLPPKTCPSEVAVSQADVVASTTP